MCFQVKLSAQQYHVNRLTHKNKRWCRDSTYTFSAAHQIETNQIRRNVTQAFTHGKQVTKAGGNVVFENHDAWTVLDDIKCTPRFWKKKKAELYAKLDNIGPFQWFFTLSCADKRWPATLFSVIQERDDVRKVVTELITDDDGYTSPKTLIHTTTDAWPVDLDVFMERLDMSLHEVIRQNVIEATRYFDFRVKAFVKEVVMGGANPMAIQFYSYRVEFQARGAAHIHGVLWADIDKLEQTEKEGSKHLLGLKAAFKALRDDKVPQHVERGDKPISKAHEKKVLPFLATNALTNFIDEFITCSLHKGSVGETVVKIAQEVQTHRHTQTCLKKGGSSCRFGYPKFPSAKTIIAKPYDSVSRNMDDMDKAEKELAKVQKVLENKELLDQVIPNSTLL